MTKQCTKCKEVKDLNEFLVRPDQRVGRRGICSQCYNNSRRNDV